MPTAAHAPAWPFLPACGIAPLALALALALLLCVLLAGPASANPADRAIVPGPALDTIEPNPPLRIRVARGQAQVTVAGPTTLLIRSATDPTIRPVAVASPLTITRRDGAFAVVDANRKTLTWQLQAARIDPVQRHQPTPLTLGDKPLPGHLTLHPAGPDRFDAINHTDLETYLPGVLHRELFPDWPAETFRAQAIAARSYALWERHRNHDKHYDLESTVASQAYAGLIDLPNPTQAVAATRGVVLAFEGRVVPAFYSSTIGRHAQDMAVVFADRTPVIAPLQGGNRGDWDRISKHYQWGPFAYDLDAASQSVRRWAQRRQHPAAELDRITQVRSLMRDAWPLPVGYELTDTRGHTYRFRPIHLQHALADAAEPPLKSPDITATVRGNQLIILRGYGYGHGVGMSQYGAFAMAQAGHDHRDILANYYPGARLTRLYR
jgi:stage II sporulation protein D